MSLHNFLINRNEIDFEYEAPIEKAMAIPNDDIDILNDNIPAITKRNEIVHLLQ